MSSFQLYYSSRFEYNDSQAAHISVCVNVSHIFCPLSFIVACLCLRVTNIYIAALTISSPKASSTGSHILNFSPIFLLSFFSRSLSLYTCLYLSVCIVVFVMSILFYLYHFVPLSSFPLRIAPCLRVSVFFLFLCVSSVCLCSFNCVFLSACILFYSLLFVCLSFCLCVHRIVSKALSMCVSYV